MEVMAGCWGRCGVRTVDDDARGSKQEVIQQLLDQRWTWKRKSYTWSHCILVFSSCRPPKCVNVWMYICVFSPRCSFSLPQSESKVLMSRRCPARRMLSASLVSISELQLGSKLSSQEISSSSMVAALTFNASISDAGGGQTGGEK